MVGVGRRVRMATVLILGVLQQRTSMQCSYRWCGAGRRPTYGPGAVKPFHIAGGLGSIGSGPAGFLMPSALPKACDR